MRLPLLAPLAPDPVPPPRVSTIEHEESPRLAYDHRAHEGSPTSTGVGKYLNDVTALSVWQIPAGEGIVGLRLWLTLIVWSLWRMPPRAKQPWSLGSLLL